MEDANSLWDRSRLSIKRGVFMKEGPETTLKLTKCLNVIWFTTKYK